MRGTLLLLASFMVAGAQEDPALQSGPKPGSPLPGPFTALNINGKIAAGRPHCLVCQNGLNPAVLAFVRESAEAKGDAVATLMKEFDALAAKQENLGAFVVYLSPAAKSSLLDVQEADIDKLLAEAKARDALLGRLQERAKGLENAVVAAFPDEGPKGYQLSAKAEVTVIFYDRLKVLENWSFAPGALTDAAVTKIIDQVKQRLQPAKAPAKKPE